MVRRAERLLQTSGAEFASPELQNLLVSDAWKHLYAAMQHESDTNLNPQRLVIEAIALKRAITAEYNGTEMLLAPHLLFSRHDDLFLSALNLRKTWRSEEEMRLGAFKLDGLSNIALTDDTFESLSGFEPVAPRETDQEVFALA
jgi:hypothetical protein